MSNIVFISYPKSGRTWIHKIFEKYEEFSGSPVKQQSVVLRTHLGYGGNERTKLKEIERLDTPRHVLLTRNIPDTLVSFYHDEKVRKYRGGVKGTIDEFVLEYKSYIDDFYTKTEEYDWDYRFSYEDMQQNPYETILPFAKIIYGPIDTTALHKSIEFCNFSNLSRLERDNKEDMQVSRVHRDHDFFKTRKGQVGSAKEELKPETLKQLL